MADKMTFTAGISIPLPLNGAEKWVEGVKLTPGVQVFKMESWASTTSKNGASQLVFKLKIEDGPKENIGKEFLHYMTVSNQGNYNYLFGFLDQLAPDFDKLGMIDGQGQVYDPAFTGGPNGDGAVFRAELYEDTFEVDGNEQTLIKLAQGTIKLVRPSSYYQQVYAQKTGQPLQQQQQMQQPQMQQQAVPGLQQQQQVAQPTMAPGLQPQANMAPPVGGNGAAGPVGL